MFDRFQRNWRMAQGKKNQAHMLPSMWQQRCFSFHTLSIYGLEGCRDKNQQAQFRIGNGAFTSFSNADQHNPIPEPTSLALLGLGLFGMALNRDFPIGAPAALFVC